MIKLSRLLFLASFAVMAFLVDTPILQAQTSDTRGWLEAMIEDAVSSEDLSIDLQGLDGLLGSTATIEKIVISDRQGPWLTIDDVVLDWNRMALARGNLEVNELSAGRIEVSRKPEFPADPLKAEAQSGITIPTLPELPVGISIGRVSTPELTIGESLAGEELSLSVAGQARLAGGSAFLKVNLSQLGSEGRIDLLGSYESSTGYLTIALEALDEAQGYVTRKLGIPGAPSLSLSLNGAGPITDFSAETRLATDSEDRVQGTFRISPQAEDGSLVFSTDLGGDLRPMLPEDLHDFFGHDARVVVDGRRSASGDIELGVLRLSSQSLTLSGQATLSANGKPQQLLLTTEIKSPTSDLVLLPFSQGRVSVGHALAELSYGSRDGRWTLNADIADMATIDGAVGRAVLAGSGSSPSGTGLLDGNLGISVSDITLIDTGLQEAIGSNADVELGFHLGEDGSFAINSLSLRAAGHALTGSLLVADLAVGLAPRVQGDLKLLSSDLSRFRGVSSSMIAGAGDLSLSFEAAPLSGSFDVILQGQTTDLAVGDDRFDPILKAQTEIFIAATRDHKGIRIDGFSLSSDQVSVAGSGIVSGGQAWASLDITLADTSSLLSGPSGQAHIQADITKQGEIVNAKGLLIAPGGVDMSFSTDVILPAAGRGLSLSGIGHASILDLAPYGLLVGRDLSGSATLDISYAGHPEDQNFSLVINGEAQDIQLDDERVDQLLLGRSTINVAASILRGEASIETLSIANDQMKVEGSGTMSQSAGGMSLDLRLFDTALVVPGYPGESRVQASLRPDGNRYAIDASFTGPVGTHGTIDGTFAQDISGFDLVLSAVAPAGLANPFIAPRRVDGHIEIDLALRGPASLSALSGDIRLRDGSLSLPNLRLAARNVRADAHLADGALSLSVNAEPAKGGNLSIDGAVALSDALDADLVVRLDGIGASDPALYDTIVDGEITIQGPLLKGSTIAGQITLGETILRIPEAIAGVYGPIPGMIHLREHALSRLARERAGFTSDEAKAAAGGSGSRHKLDLRITAPARVFVRGRGLDAELGGELRIEGDTLQPVPSGAFELRRGRLDILGQRLDLSQGILRLSGTFDPELSLTAESKTEIGTAKILIEGSASSPSLTLSSEPVLPQDEVLSMLLFGKSVTDMSAIEGLKLANAVRTLTNGGGEGIMGRVRVTLGVDDLDFASSDSGEASVGVGKYLADGLYANTSVSVSGETKIELNFEVNDRITARGQASSAGTAGLGLFFEKNY